ncbi:MAG: DUF3341 domain-containing protein [Verrucomicrobia bacterium]|nr:DUF3341 domain-containing protein [Verrucomicrobiota bacterium]MCF7708252.1 DUF3341 domain-containing protein [Verrucomicrobiota bacterium]
MNTQKRIIQKAFYAGMFICAMALYCILWITLKHYNILYGVTSNIEVSCYIPILFEIFIMSAVLFTLVKYGKAFINVESSNESNKVYSNNCDGTYDCVRDQGYENTKTNHTE